VNLVLANGWLERKGFVMFRLIIRNLETNLDIPSKVVYSTLQEAMAVARTQSMGKRRTVRVEQVPQNVNYGGTAMLAYPNDLLTERA